MLLTVFFVAGALITFVFLVLTVAFQPYTTLSLNRTQTSTLVSLFLNLFLGVMLCLTRYMDLDLQQNCKNELNADKCTKWKSVERMVVEITVTIINISVPLVPIINFALSDTAGTRFARFYSSLAKICRGRRSERAETDPTSGAETDPPSGAETNKDPSGPLRGELSISNRA
jgi:hypothetical protein